MQTFSTLNTIGFLLDHCVWATPEEFDQSCITMGFKITSLYTQQLGFVVTHLQTNTGTAFILMNPKLLAFKLLIALEDKMDMNGAKGDAIYIHGSLKRKEELNNIKLLMSALTVEDFHPHILMATAAADLVIDCPDVLLVIMMEWPEDIATYVQRRGRAAQRYAASVMSTCDWTIILLSCNDLSDTLAVGWAWCNGQRR